MADDAERDSRLQSQGDRAGPRRCAERTFDRARRDCDDARFRHLALWRGGKLGRQRPHAEGNHGGDARGDGSQILQLRHLRALPAVQRLARVRRGFGNRRSRDLDRQARPGNVGRPARRRMTMNINTSPDAIVRSTAQLTPGYMSGFGNSFETEALPGALPMGRNSPQRCAYGLYAEQLSGSPFTAPRGTNERSWLYRIRPSVQHAPKFKKAALPYWKTAPSTAEHDRPIGQLRWSPVPIPKEKLTFLTGMRTMTT